MKKLLALLVIAASFLAIISIPDKADRILGIAVFLGIGMAYLIAFRKEVFSSFKRKSGAKNLTSGEKWTLVANKSGLITQK